MRQTFLYASTDCLRIVHPPPSHNLKWLFFRLFPHNSYLRVRSNDLLNEGDILINDDDLAMTETEKNLQFWPRPQNSVFKDEKNNGGEVGDLDGPRAVYQIHQRRQEGPLNHGGGGDNPDARLGYAIAYRFNNRHLLFACSCDFLRSKKLYRLS